MNYFAIDKEPCLIHYGTRGMHWGIRRYQNYDGTKIKNGNIVVRKGKKYVRFSNRKEKGPAKGIYASTSKADVEQYLIDAKRARLGFKDYDQVYATKIEVVNDAIVRSGKSMVRDALDKIGDKSLDEAYKILDDAGYLDDRKSSSERYDIWSSDQKIKKARNSIGHALNNEIYKKNKEKYFDKYAKEGYDAVIDPEDFMWNYETPTYLLNDKKFRRSKQRSIVKEPYRQYEKHMRSITDKDEYKDYIDDYKRLHSLLK